MSPFVSPPSHLLPPGALGLSTPQEGLDDGPDFLSEEDRGVSFCRLLSRNLPSSASAPGCGVGRGPRLRCTSSPASSFGVLHRPAPRPPQALPPWGGHTDPDFPRDRLPLSCPPNRGGTLLWSSCPLPGRGADREVKMGPGALTPPPWPLWDDKNHFSHLPGLTLGFLAV